MDIGWQLAVTSLSILRLNIEQTVENGIASTYEKKSILWTTICCPPP